MNPVGEIRRGIFIPCRGPPVFAGRLFYENLQTGEMCAMNHKTKFSQRITAMFLTAVMCCSFSRLVRLPKRRMQRMKLFRWNSKRNRQ